MSHTERVKLYDPSPRTRLSQFWAEDGDVGVVISTPHDEESDIHWVSAETALEVAEMLRAVAEDAQRGHVPLAIGSVAHLFANDDEEEDEDDDEERFVVYGVEDNDEDDEENDKGNDDNSESG